jgi:hypothetical protein
MSAATKLIAEMRTRRGRTPPAGDLRSTELLIELLTVMLEARLEELAETVPPRARRWDVTHGRFITDSAEPSAPDPTGDEIACQLAMLIGHLEDLTK